MLIRTNIRVLFVPKNTIGAYLIQSENIEGVIDHFPIFNFSLFSWNATNVVVLSKCSTILLSGFLYLSLLCYFSLSNFIWYSVVLIYSVQNSVQNKIIVNVLSRFEPDLSFQFQMASRNDGSKMAPYCWRGIGKMVLKVASPKLPNWKWPYYKFPANRDDNAQ